jgi:hypothetical protein
LQLNTAFNTVRDHRMNTKNPAPKFLFQDLQIISSKGAQSNHAAIPFAKASA